MDAGLIQAALTHRTAAAHAVAGALVPKGAGGTARGAGTATAATGGTTNTNPSTPASNNSTITSGDFLTLLVNELKHQDPTQPTDPNAYITQLAQVNSLEQLISINTGIQNLDTLVPKSGTKTPGILEGNTQPATAPATTSQVHERAYGAKVR